MFAWYLGRDYPRNPATEDATPDPEHRENLREARILVHCTVPPIVGRLEVPGEG